MSCGGITLPAMKCQWSGKRMLACDSSCRLCVNHVVFLQQSTTGQPPNCTEAQGLVGLAVTKSWSTLAKAFDLCIHGVCLASNLFGIWKCGIIIRGIRIVHLEASQKCSLEPVPVPSPYRSVIAIDGPSGIAMGGGEVKFGMGLTSPPLQSHSLVLPPRLTSPPLPSYATGWTNLP